MSNAIDIPSDTNSLPHSYRLKQTLESSLQNRALAVIEGTLER